VIETVFGWMEWLYGALGSTTQISPWVYLLVMAGGVASALSPCYVPVLTMFGGYVGGYARGSKTEGLRLALPFILGNAITLGMVGGIASFMGSSAMQIFTSYQLDRWIPGWVGVAMGLQLVGILRLKMPVMPIFRWARRPGGVWGSFALGLPFGLVVTPCTIPIFFAIVTFVALQGSILHGALLMMAYALGRGAILLTVAVSIGLIKALNIGHTSWYIERLSGILILVASVGLLVFYRDFVQWTMQWMPMGMMR
jgi:cytochrome c-type biogenesis protein